MDSYSNKLLLLEKQSRKYEELINLRLNAIAIEESIELCLQEIKNN